MKYMFNFKRYFKDIYYTLLKSKSLFFTFIAYVIGMIILKISNTPIWFYMLYILICGLIFQYLIYKTTNWYKEYNENNYFIKKKEIKLENVKGQWNK